MNTATDVIVVGAGAAGLAAAIFTARHGPALRVVALDGAKRIGAKILVSGGGRCNVTNVRVTPDDYYGGNPRIIRRVLQAFDEHATRAFFESIGAPLHEEEFGKLFPDSNSARTVVDALLREAERLNVRVLTEHRVTAVSAEADGFAVTVGNAEAAHVRRCRRLVLATGGLSLPKTGSDGGGYLLAKSLGHTITPTTPALDPLILSGEFHTPLSGVSQPLQLTFTERDQKPVRISGPALWTHFGLSGPAALNVSRFWRRAQVNGAACELSASFVDGAAFADVERTLIDGARAEPRSTLGAVLHRWMPARVGEALLTALALDPRRPVAQTPRDDRRRVVHALCGWPLAVTGTRGYKFAEVTAGGVPLSEIDVKGMGSRCTRGLHLVGEICDVDGRLGGFNFQWAWSSGFVAGAAIARELS